MSAAYAPVNAADASRSNGLYSGRVARSAMMSGGVQDIIDQQVAGAMLQVEAALDDEMNRIDNLNVCRRRHTCQRSLPRSLTSAASTCLSGGRPAEDSGQPVKGDAGEGCGAAGARHHALARTAATEAEALWRSWLGRGCGCG